MKEFELKSYRVEALTFENQTKGAVKMELGYEYSYNVGYSDNNTCRGEFKIKVYDKAHTAKFHLDMTLVGHFVTAPGVAKEVLHVKTYDALFPYVKSVVSTFTVNAGVPPIFIPYIDISEQSIYRVEMPRPEA